MQTRYTAKLRRLEDRILDGPGVLDPSIRRSAAEGEPAGDPLANDYIQKIRNNAYKIEDRNLEELKAAGWTEDQIFELTICAAFGAARHRLSAGLRAIEETRSNGERSRPVPAPARQRSE